MFKYIYILFIFTLVILTEIIFSRPKHNYVTSFYQPDDHLIQLEWFSCNTFLHGTPSVYNPKLKDIKNTYAECTYVPVPFIWSLENEEKSTTITFNFVKRYPAYREKKKGQVIISVHPLLSSKHTTICLISPTYELFALQLRDALDGYYDVLVPHTAGTGNSRPSLACSLEKKSRKRITKPEEFHSCMKSVIHQSDYISEMSASNIYSISQHAMDVLNLIRLTKHEELQRRKTKVFKMGANKTVEFENFKTIFYSQGFSSLILNRMIHLSNIIKKKRRALGMVFENDLSVDMSNFLDMTISISVLSPHVPSLSLIDHDFYFNKATLSFLDECHKDNFCKQYFKNQQFSDLFSKFYKFILPQCYPGVKLEEAKNILSKFSDSDQLKSLILPLLYRALRCKTINWDNLKKYTEDSSNYEVLPGKLYDTGNIPENDISFISYWALERIVVGSELIDFNSVKEYKRKAKEYDDLSFILGYSPYFYKAFETRKTLNVVYSDSIQFNFTTTGENFRDSFVEFETNDVPMLIMNGLSDVHRPFESNAGQWLEFYLGPNRKSLLNGLVEVRDSRFFVKFPFLQFLMRHSFTNELNPVWSKSTGLPRIIDSCAGKIFVSFIDSGENNIYLSGYPLDDLIDKRDNLTYFSKIQINFKTKYLCILPLEDFIVFIGTNYKINKELEEINVLGEKCLNSLRNNKLIDLIIYCNDFNYKKRKRNELINFD
ncbi:hypothetical protein ABK040_005357 [Willaertia magna]